TLRLAPRRRRPERTIPGTGGAAPGRARVRYLVEVPAARATRRDAVPTGRMGAAGTGERGERGEQ
ncbi:MAG: hypothetical protein KGJ43_08080, partial [Acidobacteriota bacterium]|nr:hypothetical protein [Acidobacteriota bacterium]